MGHNLTMTGLSDIGRVRKRNEDSLCLAPELGVAAVADGMGGHPGGDVASRIAADYAVRRLRALLPEPNAPSHQGTAEALRGAMAQSVMGAHHAIRMEGVRDPSLDGMGTTLTGVVLDRESGLCVIGHVGDSRAYRFRGGLLEQLTRDDTWVQKQVEEATLTREQARRHPFGHILTQCLGLADPPEPQILTSVAKEGDLYLLCTDGLVGMLDDDDLSEVVVEAAEGGEHDLEKLAEALIGGAKERGGYDNITVVLVAVSAATPPPPAE